MSLNTIISDALDAAKRFIKWILPSSKHLLDVALVVVNAIKNFDEKNPSFMDTVVNMIPGTVDDHVLAKIREELPLILVKLKWADGEANKTPDEIIADAAAFIKTLPSAEQGVALQAIWQLLSNKLTDDGVAINEIKKIGQVYYEATKGQ